MDIPAPAKPFNPKPEFIDRILDELTESDSRFREIASSYGTTVHQLALWLESPEIAQRLSTVRSAYLMRTRLVASAFLEEAAAITITLIREFNSNIRHTFVDGVTTTPEYRRRLRESTRKAVTLLVRLSRISLAPADQSLPPRSGSVEQVGLSTPLPSDSTALPTGGPPLSAGPTAGPSISAVPPNRDHAFTPSSCSTTIPGAQASNSNGRWSNASSIATTRDIAATSHVARWAAPPPTSCPIPPA